MVVRLHSTLTALAQQFLQRVVLEDFPVNWVHQRERQREAAGWGYCSQSYGGTGSGGESNYTGGHGPGFNISGDASAVSGGGSPNLGSGGANGYTVSQAGYATTNTTEAPTKPSEWGSDVTATFQGGAGVQHSSGAAGASDAGNNYGAGSGGSSSEIGAGSTANGSQGAIFVTYYEINT